MMKSIKPFLNQSIRVWKILRKPTKTELKLISKVSALGILFLGLAGFLVSIVMKIFN